jgi:hypothetical protein
MRLVLVGLAFVAWSIALSPDGLSAAQEGMARQDTRGSVTVVVTLIPPATPDAPIKAKVVLDTHAVPLDDISFQQAVVMRQRDGAEVPPTAVEQPGGSGHHREAVLVFPSLPPAGGVRIVVKDVGGVAERIFTWESVPR